MLNNLVFATTFHYGVIEQYAFSLLLFCVVFSFYSFLATSGFSQSTATLTKQESEDANQLAPFISEVKVALTVEPEPLAHLDSPQSETLLIPAVEEVSQETKVSTKATNLPTQKNGEDFKEDSTLIPTTTKEIETFVQGLKIRTARKVAKALGIRQKVNGKDKNLAQFKREIRQALRKNASLLEQAKTCLAA